MDSLNDLASHGVKLHVDRASVFPGEVSEISVYGWCWSPTRQISALSLEANGLRMPCLYGRERPDLTAHFGCQALHSGFVGRIPFSARSAAIQVSAKLDGKLEVLAEVPVLQPAPHSRSGTAPRTYSDWLLSHEPRLFWPRKHVAELMRGLPVLPTISILLPTFNTPLYYLHRCIQSVRNQAYPFWQLCIADDGSSSDAVAAVKEFAAFDDRIVLRLRTISGGTSAASNTALESATGEYVALLDHDDELHPSALLEVVRCLNTSLDADLIYSDEDKIDDEGRRFYPAFKPPFDPQMILAFNYIGHLVCIRRRVLEEVQGFRPQCDGSQDWDLLLRVIERIGPRRIKHIPKPLYHWRSHANSTAMSLDAKPHLFETWQRVLGDHVARTGKSGQPSLGLFRGSMRIHPSGSKRVPTAVVYCSHDAVDQRRAIQRTGSSQVRLFELVLSRLHAAETLSLGPPLLTPSEVDGDVLVFLNAPVDTLNHGFFDALAAEAMREDCGIAGALILSSEGYILNAGFECTQDGSLMNPFAGLHHSKLGYLGLAKVTRAVAAIGPQCFAIRKSRLQSEGGLAMLAEDALTKLCQRLIQSAHRKSLRVIYTPYAVMTTRLDSPDEPLLDVSSRPNYLYVNPNIEAFESPRGFLQGGYVE